MRTRRAQSRTTSRYASVVERLESRYLLSGAGDLVGDTPLTAQPLGILTTSQPLEVFGTIDEAFDLDVFQFQADAQGSVTIELFADHSFLDTFVSLLDSSGTPVAFNDDIDVLNFNFDSRLTFNIEGGETYFVAVESSSFADIFSSTGDYQLSVVLNVDLVGDTIETATNLGLLTAARPLNVSGTIEQASDRDIFQFQADVQGPVIIELFADDSFLDTFVSLLDSSGTPVASNDDIDFFNFDSRLVFTIEGGETYFVSVESSRFAGFTSSTGDYQLSVVLDVDSVGDARETATNLPLVNGQATFDSRINPRDSGFDRDFFRIQAPTDTNSIINVRVDTGAIGSADGLDSLLQVTDANGAVIGFNDDQVPGDNRQSIVQFNATAGEIYFLEVRPFDGTRAQINSASGSYSLIVDASPGEVPDAVTNNFNDPDNIPKVISLTSGFALTRVSIDYPADQDVFSFVAPSDGIVRVGHQSRRDVPLDAQLAVFNNQHRLLQRSPVPLSPHFSSDLEFSVTAGETYFVRASLNPSSNSVDFGAPTGTYALTLQMVSNVPAPAPQLLTPDGPISISGTIDVLGDTDTVEFTVGQNVSQINIDFSFVQSLSGALSIFVRRGNDFEIVDYRSDFFPFGQETFSIANVMAGDTFVVVVDSNSGIGDYRLLIEEIGPDDFPDFIDASGVPIVEVNPTALVTGRIGDFFDVDVFRIDAPVGSQLVVPTASNVFVDVAVRLPNGEVRFFDSGDQISITGQDEVFLEVQSTFAGPSSVRYEITLQSLVTDGRHDSFATAQTTVSPNGDPEQITRTADTFEIVGQLDTTQDSDFFTFIAPFTGEVTISAPQSSVGVNSDSLSFGVSVFESFRFFDGSFASPFLIASDVNGQAVRSNEGLSVFVFEGDQYFVSVNNQGATIGGYQLDLDPVTDGFANDFATAAPVTLSVGNEGSVNNGRLESAFDADFFSFVAQQSGSVSIELSPGTDGSGQPSELSAFLEVYSGPGFDNFLAGDLTVNQSITTTFNVIAGATYFFAVFNNGFAASSYRIVIQPFVVRDDVPPGGRNLSNFSSAAPTVVTGSLEISGDIDTYRLIADATQSLQISLDATTSSVLDPILTVRVFNADGSPAGSPRTNDDFGFSLNSFLSVAVTAGQTIEIDARGFGSSRGNYRLTITGAANNGNDGGVATVLTPTNQTQSGDISQSFGTDAFRFTAVTTGNATVALNASTGSALDPIVTIRNTADASFVTLFDDDSGPGLNSLVTFSTVAGQSYDIIAGGFGFSIGAYSLNLSFDSVNGDDFGDTFDRAQLLTFRDGTSFFQAGQISPISDGREDADVFSFLAEFSGTLNLRVLAFENDLRAGLSVFQADPDGNINVPELLAVAGAATVGEQTNLFVPVNEGLTYFVRLVGLAVSEGGPTTSGSYLLGANATADLVPAAPSDARIDLVAGIGTVESQIDFESDRDWYRVVAPLSGTFTINLERRPDSVANQLDPILTVYDDRELPIARNDDSSSSTLNSQLTIQAREAGEVFFIEAAGIDIDSSTGGTVGGYRLRVNFAAGVADDIGNDPGHMQLISVNANQSEYELSGSLEMTQDRDFFVFTAAIDASATIVGTSLPTGVEFRVFEVEVSDPSNISIDNLTQIASISGQTGVSALESFTFDVRQRQSYVVAVSHIGATLNSPVNYTLPLSFDANKISDDTALENAAHAALLSLADDAADAGDRDPGALDNAVRAAAEKLQSTGLTFFVLVVDPVNEFGVTDSGQRQTGLSNGAVNEIPGSFFSGGTFGQVVIVQVPSSGFFDLSLAGFGTNLGQSFSAFTVGPSGVQRASQEGARTTPLADGKSNFVVQLGFGDSTPTVVPIPTPGTASDAQFPSFFMMTNAFSTGRGTPSDSEGESGIEDSVTLRFEDELRQSIDRQSEEDPGFDWPRLLDEVLEHLQFDGNSRQSIRRLVEDLQERGATLPVQLLLNSDVGRSAKVMYDVLRHSAGWFRNAKPTTPPAPKQRTTVPKVTQETPSPKNASQTRVASKKMTHLGG